MAKHLVSKWRSWAFCFTGTTNNAFVRIDVIGRKTFHRFAGVHAIHWADGYTAGNSEGTGL